MATNPKSPEPVPLNVWPCAQTTAQYLRAGRYLSESTEHPGKMLPDLARRIFEEYSTPGDLARQSGLPLGVIAHGDLLVFCRRDGVPLPLRGIDGMGAR